MTLSACGDSGSSRPGLDAAPLDAGITDAGASDAGPTDARNARDAGRDAGLDAGVDAGAPDAGSGPPYPIVLCHGFFGFQDFAGVDFATYFYRVKDDLAAHGETAVFTPAVDPFADSIVRGAQLLERVEAIVAETGARKVNLIGHSQGGLDVRFVASTHPELVASVTTIAAPHHGTPIADVVLGLVRDDRARDLADALVLLVGAPLYDEVGRETSVFAALRQLSSDGVTDFNRRYPDAPGIPYFSLTGRTGLSRGGSDCETPDAPWFVHDFRDTVDPVDALLALPSAITGGDVLDPVPNDGLVPVPSARWGTFLGCVPADHLDEIGHLFGDRPGLANDWDYRAFYRALVAWLRSRDL